jgi:hypothetical protein
MKPRFWNFIIRMASILMHPDRITRFYIEKDGPRLTQSSKFRAAFPLTIVNIPTLAPLEADELFVADATEARNAPTRLASRVFRNTWFSVRAMNLMPLQAT